MKKGFTLVEVVLTLSIIGVIAAITIPTMIHHTNKKATIEQLKKTAATLNQAVYNATITGGQVNTWTWATDEGISQILHNNIVPRLNVGYLCSGNVTQTKHCSYDVKPIDGEPININTMFQAKARVILNDGSFIAFTDANSFMNADREEGEGGETSGDDELDNPTGVKCNWEGTKDTLCGVFMVDVNGSKKPNMVGKDVFYYGIYLSGAVLPYGANEEIKEPGFIDGNCTAQSSGFSCAAKITQDGWDVCYNNCGEDVTAYPVRF